MKVLLLDTKRNFLCEREIQRETRVAEMRELLGSESIDSFDVTFGKRKYIIYFDRQGKKKQNIVSAIIRDSGETYVGNLVITAEKKDKLGIKEYKDMTDTDYDIVGKNTVMFPDGVRRLVI